MPLAAVPPPPPPAAPSPGALRALLAGRCPRCRSGAIFAGRLGMNPSCPACGLVFQRESGYFVGAMYASYALALPLLALLAALVKLLWPAATLWTALFLAAVLFLPLVPWVFRSSRILWIHFDRWADRGE